MATAGLKIKLDDISGAFGFGSALFSRKRRDQAIGDSYSFNRGVSRYNQYIAKERGKETLQAGATEFADVARRGRYDAEQLKADAAARGVSASEGSSAELYQGMQDMNSVSENRVMANTYSAARAEYDRISELRQQEKLAKLQKRYAQDETKMEMFGSMFSNAKGFANTLNGLRGWFGS